MFDRFIQEVEKKYGGKIATSSDCKYLSLEINDTINELISDSTLRRFFGFLQTSSKPSTVTLNILSKYIGFEDWKDFKAFCLHFEAVVGFFYGEGGRK